MKRFVMWMVVMVMMVPLGGMAGAQDDALEPLPFFASFIRERRRDPNRAGRAALRPD
ncbi:MAG: hypothetical protein MUC99_10320 [Anaerolineae bacterium]|nr:hypothetical protein [Anaerolineae bacterium]